MAEWEWLIALVSIASGLGASVALGFAFRHHLHIVAHDRQETGRAPE